MTIRSRMTLWYGGVLLVSALVIAALSLRELREPPEKEEGLSKDWEDVVVLVCWIGVPAVALSLLGGWWLMRKALAPVAALTQAAQQMNDRTLGQPLPQSGNGDELDQLAEMLNAMTARLEGSFTRIREFTLHASHELKTPLTVMHGEVETALREESLTPPQRERLLSQLDELQRLSRIVDGLTLLTRADAGQVAMNADSVRLDELVREAWADARILAEPRGIQVEMGACDEATVRGDRHRLRQLLLNLADNAIKYNDTGGSVAMSLNRQNGEARVVMANTGPGIPAETLPRVFDRFFRGDPAHGTATEGCGLGLSIAQWIISAHKGAIQIESVPAKLTTVTVRLPLASVEEPA